MKHVDYDEWEDKNVMHIQFEEFVKNFDTEKAKLDQFLGVPAEYETQTDISKSAFNADKYSNRLTGEEMKTIEVELEKYLYF